MLIPAIAIGPAFMASAMIAQGTGELVFRQAVEFQDAPEMELPDDGTEYLDMTGRYIAYDKTQTADIEAVDVRVDGASFLWVGLLGTALCAAAVAAASVSIIRMKPRSILARPT